MKRIFTTAFILLILSYITIAQVNCDSFYVRQDSLFSKGIVDDYHSPAFVEEFDTCLDDFREEMRKQNLVGKVTIELLVDTTGSVICPRIRESNNQLINEYLIKSIQDCEFIPPTREGSPIISTFILPIKISSMEK